MSPDKPRKRKKPQRVENLMIGPLFSRIAPYGLWHFANDYLSAAKCLPAPQRPAHGRDTRWSPVRSFLICRSIELSLKAFLSLRNVSLDLLAGDLEHNLNLLLDKANENGMSEIVILSAAEIYSIKSASDYYARKIFEYPDVVEMVSGYSGNQDADKILGISERIINLLHKPCLDSS